MNTTKNRSNWGMALASWGPRFLPFADAASDDLPLSRLLRLSLFQISVGMAMVMLVGTLNRVMIVELKVSATLVSFMVALPLLIAPLRALIGFRSDNHRSQLGWRRVPYIWMGSLLQFGGFSIMPFALLVLAGDGQASQAPAWVGQLGAAGAFLLVGLGMHTVQTAGLALATDLAPPERQPQVVGLMYVMQLIGMIGSALVLGYLLHDYSPGQLIRVVQAVAVTTLVLNVIALWKQEPRSRLRKPGTPIDHTFAQAWQLFCQGPNTVRRLLETPGAWSELVADRSLIPAAVDEGLRHDSSVLVWRRRATVATEIGGVAIPAGAAVVLLLGAANHDPRVFADPDRFDLHRTDAHRQTGRDGAGDRLARRVLVGRGARRNVFGSGGDAKVVVEIATF